MQADRTITLTSELFEEVSEQARAEGKTPDELVAEAARRLLRTRKLDLFVDRNRRDAEAKGLRESDVPRLISEYRRERREH